MVLLLVLALLAPVAHASGGGAGAAFGGAGVTVPGSAHAYVALPSGRGALIQAIVRGRGFVERWKPLPRAYGVPMVAGDGSTTGLSADGEVLVLLEQQAYFPVRRTRLLVLTKTFRELGRISLPGRYTVAALSPHGRFIYLRRYTAPNRHPNRAEVVVYDRAAPGAPAPISEPASGVPTSSISDGRWAYTLFQITHSWVQAVDTVRQTTRRWELPGLRGNDLMRLSLRGGRLHVGDHTSLAVP